MPARSSGRHHLLASASGRELCERGLVDDIRYAAECEVSEIVPVLVDGAFRKTQVLAAGGAAQPSRHGGRVKQHD